MAIYRGCTKVSGIGRSFNPGNLGCEGQVLTRTQCGYEWCDSQGGGDTGPKVDVIVVGGGGNGGYGNIGGGGGGGGVKECKGYLLNSNSISVCVGAGGSKAYEQNNGGDSCFGDLVALGGGAGGKCGSSSNYGQGCPGGNGGGASGGNSLGYMRIGGIGMKGGNQGGNAGYYSGGGGGGAGGPGQSGTKNCCCCCCNTGGRGGQGYNSEMFCPDCLFSSGGNGGGFYVSVREGAFPGGGDFGCNATFYGGGGGGGFYCTNNQCYYCGGAGYQGVVMVKYKTDGSCGFPSATGGTITTEGDYFVHTFTSDGVFSIGNTPFYGLKYLIIGGGGGGRNCHGGGGGAICEGTIYDTNTEFPIIVGAGGCGINGSSTSCPIVAGGSSSFQTSQETITAPGGQMDGKSGSGCSGTAGGGGACGNGGDYCGGAGKYGMGGGGGACWENSGGTAAGRDGGGDKGQNATNYGGGGGSNKNGCQGLVEVCYLCGTMTATGGDSCYVCDGYCVHRFTSDGTFCITG